MATIARIAKVGVAVASGIRAFRAFLVDFGAVLLIVVCVIVLVDQLSTNSVEIESIEVPKALDDAGYSPRVVAQHLLDGVLGVEQRTKFIGPAFIDHSSILADENLNIVAPGTAISATTIVNRLKSLLGFPALRVSGDITGSDGVWSLRLRLDNEEELGSTKIVETSKIEDVVAEGAELILRKFEPTIYAAHLYDSQRLAQAIDQIKTIISGSRNSNHTIYRAYVLWALILIDQNDDRSGIEKLKIALNLEPTAGAFGNLGMAYSINGQFENAVAALRKAI